jgi:hypothetical protein
MSALEEWSDEAGAALDGVLGDCSPWSAATSRSTSG